MGITPEKTRFIARFGSFFPFQDIQQKMLLGLVIGQYALKKEYINVRREAHRSLKEDKDMIINNA